MSKLLIPVLFYNSKFSLMECNTHTWLSLFSLHSLRLEKLFARKLLTHNNIFFSAFQYTLRVQRCVSVYMWESCTIYYFIFFFCFGRYISNMCCVVHIENRKLKKNIQWIEAKFTLLLIELNRLERNSVRCPFVCRCCECSDQKKIKSQFYPWTWAQHFEDKLVIILVREKVSKQKKKNNYLHNCGT